MVWAAGAKLSSPLGEADLITLIGYHPVHHIPPVLAISFPFIFIFEVIGMLPDI
jgi:hypothetical protein